MLQKYFETKIGEKINKRMVTGNDFFTEVYERVYKIEVIGVNEGTLHVEVESYDKVPSGYRKGGSEQYLGETIIDLNKFKTKDEVMQGIINKVDKRFFIKYFR